MKDQFWSWIELVDICITTLIVLGFAAVPVWMAIVYRSLWWLLFEILILPLLLAGIDASIQSWRKVFTRKKHTL